VSNPTFKRGQVEWALWRAFTLYRTHADTPPPIFKTRIKRLLDLDREDGADRYAFVAPVDGSGVESAYAPFDAFCLGLALDLLDVGFKQGEIVLVMRHLRPELETWFPKVLGYPSLIDRQNHLSNRHPDLPAIERGGGRAPLADARVFLILNRVELTEIFSARTGGGKASPPVVLEPEFCRGTADLQGRLQKLMPLHRRTVIVVEITALAQAVAGFLDKAPLVPRGRPRRCET
jgi:hypothetical protein